MDEFNKYNEEKDSLLKKIKIVESKFLELDEMGINIEDSLKKLNNAKSIIANDMISIVLVGAFSDGKTSVIAGWIDEKMDNMKIDSDESSNEILCYSPKTLPKGCQIVDTPGLFGDKIGLDDDGMKMALSDITKKYISEANLIYYVVTAKNPIKDSHKECIKWILKDLNKLGTTVFVINKMDDVADLTDEDDYQLQSRIKTDDLKHKLLECGLNQNEINQVKIACISAAPNGLDIDAWKSHRDEYLRRSHLATLEKITNNVLKSSRDDLITKTGCDVLNNEIEKMISTIDNEIGTISKVLPDKEEALKRNKKDLDALYKRIIRSKKDMKDSLKSLNKRKINAIRAASMENFQDVLEDEIGVIAGKEGYVLNDEVNDICMEYVTKFSGWSMQLGNKFQSEYDKQNEKMDFLLKQGLSGAANGLKMASKIGVSSFKNGIFAGRDLLSKLGVAIKFKPWQVTKLATFATKALPLIGAGIDVVTNVVENISLNEKNRKFEESKKNIKEAINDTFYDLLEKVKSDDSFIDEFAPSYRLLEQQIKEDEEEIKNYENLIIRFKTWVKEIDDDFRIV